MKKLLLYFLTAFSLLLIVSCGSEDSVVTPEFNVSGIVLPASIDVEFEGVVTLKVIGDKGPIATDIVRLESSNGKIFRCPITEVQAKSFSFGLSESVVSGLYTLSIIRSEETKLVGQFQINIIYPQEEITPEEGATVYGLVHCAGTPLANVVVSDGYEVVKTNEKGVYQMTSAKKHGYVFVSIPSGYTVLLDGARPLIHEYLLKEANVAERVDFSLIEDPDQDNHVMVVMGDIHLANRNNDRTQFSKFVADLNSHMSSNPTKYYGLTLGDMSWDQYWIPNGYDLKNYLGDIAALKNIPVFNTIGNHDHEQAAAGDFNTVVTYKRIVGPTYYSFNIGKVHYVSLDDIECTNDGKGGRTHKPRIVVEQIDWLKKDLQFVNPNTPVVISMHAPVYENTGSGSLENYNELIAAVGSRPCHFMTAHTHMMYNVEKTGHYEHNAGAICATWWWTGKETPGIHLSTDGTPGGYILFDVKGTEFKWVYKSIDKPVTHQFRTYDRNQIQLTAAKYIPSANDANKDTFNKLAVYKAYSSSSSANEVYINVWNYDSSWSIEVKENGTNLTVEKSGGYDPLHAISYPFKRLNTSTTRDVTFPTKHTYHIFKVKASSANSTLSIKVTDRFGNVYTEEMKRPKAFTIENYL